ncbi:MAG: SRPBCC domain-containing protein [Planctomycetota bacterium]
MSVQSDGSGKRWIQVEIEVPGTPEEVWKAIATGPGMECWFMPLGTNADETEQKVGGAIYMGSGDEKQKVGEYTEWDPPRRFVAEGQSWGPDAPALAHEWTVETKAGGTCIVRVVNSYFADSSDWDNQLGDMDLGWARFFRILQRYMTDFSGQPCAAIHLMGPTGMPQSNVWETMTGAFGLDGAKEGAPWKSAIAGASELSGTVHQVEAGAAPSAILRVDGSVSGTASPLAFTIGGQTMFAVGIYLYGDGAADFVAREEPKWQSWMQETFFGG